MRIKRIFISDFGVFRDEILEDIDKDIIVIGGYNRAGKTTFMKLFRHIGFGFSSKDKNLPKPNIEYGVSCDIENNKGEIFNINITGNKAPTVTALNSDKKLSIEDLYGDIDYFTYKQLFTLSLDELQNTSTDSSKEIGNMQSIFLGAGFKEIVQIPKLLNELEKEAKKIGGKNGNPSTAQFKPYYMEIKEGIKLRKKASTQVEDYYEKKNQLNKNKECIFSLKDYIKTLKDKINLLSTLKSNFKSYEQLRILDISLESLNIEGGGEKFKNGSLEKALDLKNEYENILERYNLKNYEFIQSAGEVEKIKSKLLIHKDDLKKVNGNISGISEKISNYNEVRDDCIRNKSEISKKISSLNEKWKNNFSKVLSIPTDTIHWNRLINIVEEQKDLIYKRRELENEVKSLKSSKEVLNKTAPRSELINFNKLLNRYFYMSLVIILCGVILAFVRYKEGIILSLSGAILGGMYTIVKYSSNSNKITSNKEIYIKLDEVTVELQEKESELDRVIEKLKVREDDLKNYGELMDIKESTSGEFIKEYFRKVKEIKEGLINLQSLIDKATGVKCELDESFSLIFSLLENFREVLNEEEKELLDEEPINNSRELFALINKLNSYVDLAEELNRIKYEKSLLEDKIRKLVSQEIDENNILQVLDSYIEENESYRELLEIKSQHEIVEKTLVNTFKLICDKEEASKFRSFFEKYTCYEQIQEEYEICEKEYLNSSDKLESLTEEEQKLKHELTSLLSTKDIELAQRKIDISKNSMEFLAKKYASLKTAEFILEKIQNDFMEKTKDSLLKGASKYMQEITRGEYTDILPVDNLMEVDFKTVLKDGSTKENSNILSRATKEQLFLSVRLSRINEITPSLPIILDDSFVNFDEIHTREVIKVLNYLSKSNQIFITTCHSRLVEYIGQVGRSVKYLKLENGKFINTDKDSLVKYLNP